MNGAYLHLLTNHIPVVGVPMSFFLLLAGLWRKSRDLIQAGFVALIVLALITIVAFKSGGPAAHVIRNNNIQGIVRATIHEHAEAADYAFGIMDVLGALALLGFFLSLRGMPPTILTLLLLLGSLLAAVCLGRVAHLGGLIRHPEIETMPQGSPQPPGTPSIPALAAPTK